MPEWVFNHNVSENYFCKLRKLRKLYSPEKSLRYLNDSENMLKNEGQKFWLVQFACHYIFS